MRSCAAGVFFVVGVLTQSFDVRGGVEDPCLVGAFEVERSRTVAQVDSEGGLSNPRSASDVYDSCSSRRKIDRKLPSSTVDHVVVDDDAAKWRVEVGGRVDTQ